MQEGVDPESFTAFYTAPAGGRVQAASGDRRLLLLRQLLQFNAADEDLTQEPLPQGADITFNYLIDAILVVPRTKEMYMRRLRTLMDQFTNGRLEVKLHCILHSILFYRLVGKKINNSC